ncbi:MULTISPECIES: substrate-binding domain-containing protein [Lacrimispora]|jgi:ribose transport system substrate-binding protein|uniref:substrate-binding domain-containing protein n=1 Tax=Lacrimispora TaxID=2719231 RepID=UPI000BE39DA4|nr:substrate-binding domain-containing protein [Lacrimispora amygdalina]MDK2967409.1 two-component system, sensor histidine kinase YesM [Lacrimispora sp.]
MKKHKNGILLILFSALAVLFLSAVFLLDELGEKKTVKVVFIPKVQDKTNDFWMSMISGAKSAGKEYQANLVILAPDEENDYETQKKYIEEAVKMKPDVIALAPIRYSEMTDCVKQITDAGIKLILIDSKLDKDLEETYIGTDNRNAGLQMGQKMKEYVNKDTKIAVVSHVKGSSTAIEREEGLREGLGEDQNRIQAVLYSNSDYNQAYEETIELMKTHPDITLIAGLNLYSTVGVARAIKEMNLSRKVHVVGFDNDIEGIQYLEEGIIDTLIVQKPFNMGYIGIQTAVEAVRGKKSLQNIYCETEVITADNIYTDENQKLLFPF